MAFGFPLVSQRGSARQFLAWSPALRSTTIISADDSRVTVRVIPTDEALMMARHTRELMSKKADGKKGAPDARI